MRRAFFFAGFAAARFGARAFAFGRDFDFAFATFFGCFAGRLAAFAGFVPFFFTGDAARAFAGVGRAE